MPNAILSIVGSGHQGHERLIVIFPGVDNALL